jgi:iron complex outermembrane receptor protein
MRTAPYAFVYIFIASSAFGQNAFRAIVKDQVNNEPLPGATAALKRLNLGASANQEGFLEILNIPNGEHTIEVSFVGYEASTFTLHFPRHSNDTTIIELEPSSEELEEIVVSSTRSTRTIADIPTRVEFIAGEELEEKGNMKPGDIRMLLNESTGIQTQQTSATSANASIRIQGLDGRYTQILKDGFPLYAGFSGGLGLLQTPPLDLKQVEVIKGSSSTLYGGGAIAGLVNLISKAPSEESELRFWINGTSAKGLDLNGFYGEDFGKVGVTLFLSRNTNEPYDPADIDLTAIPKFERYTVNPKFFVGLSDNSKLMLGLNFTTEDRIGGDVQFIRGKGDAIHSYFEENNTDRFSTQLSFTQIINDNTQLNLKNSLSYFRRILDIPGYEFNGVQNSSFTELNLIHTKKDTEWIGGLTVWTDGFSETQSTITPLRDYDQITVGAFVQNNAKLSEVFQLEAGLRGDYVKDYSFILLPRVSLLFKPSVRFSSRIGGGFGYKPPTVFTEESERIQFQNVLPISPEINTLERSYGANWDFNYRTSIANGAVGFGINHLFFYTYLKNPLSLIELTSGDYQFVNSDGHIDTRGTETNLKFEYGDFKLFIGYTFTDTKIHKGGSVLQNPLTAKHRLNNVIMYEVEEKWKIGLEAYYFSPQKLNDGATGKQYWICGLMMERLWEHFSVYLNFENYLDTRQTRFDSIYTGTITNPVFRDIYAPVDGFVINGGVKVKI